ncbi:MAG TPA: YbhB/YbcL family Raf kinase inhibitor-like protein, partial [Longimicrobiales bacterium]|nr:YbhB/YbcL family Raf kinase inhibitor-like protein [Longimicrobiales bacterium]
PRKYTCDGANVSPALEWSGAPAGTHAFALLVEDPDARRGTWVHWIVYDIPPGVSGFPEGGPIPEGAREGRTDFGRPGYDGPCPPAGPPHRYVFRLFALDDGVRLPDGVGRTELLREISGHVLDQAELTGTYGR